MAAHLEVEPAARAKQGGEWPSPPWVDTVSAFARVGEEGSPSTLLGVSGGCVLAQPPA